MIRGFIATLGVCCLLAAFGAGTVAPDSIPAPDVPSVVTPTAFTPDAIPDADTLSVAVMLPVGLRGGCANGQCGTAPAVVERRVERKTERSVKVEVAEENADTGRRHVVRGVLNRAREAKPVRRVLGRLFCRRR